MTTLGNNANTFKPTGRTSSRPLDPATATGRPTGQFNFGFPDAWDTSECQAAPPAYPQDSDAVVSTNLFYQHNRIHDQFYYSGSPRAAGTSRPTTRAATRRIMGLVQAGAITGGTPTYTGRDNAYMLTLPDGIPPWSGMFLWEPINDAFEGPCRDGDFDAGVIEHEYAHGLSNRYVGDRGRRARRAPVRLDGRGLGRLVRAEPPAPRGLQDNSVVGTYVTGNEARGIRNWAYDENPTNFGDIGYDLGGPEVHADGEIWTATLWQMRQALVAELRRAGRLGHRLAHRHRRDAAEPERPVHAGHARRDHQGARHPLPRAGGLRRAPTSSTARSPTTAWAPAPRTRRARPTRPAATTPTPSRLRQPATRR